MSLRQLEAIVAYDLNGGMGVCNQLPWEHKADLKWFKSLTLNQCVVMGRKTFSSITLKGGEYKNGLPNRHNIVLSSAIAGVNGCGDNKTLLFASSVDDALEKINWVQRTYHLTCPYIIGGASVYEAFMPHIKYYWITVMKQICKCDTWFPHFQYPMRTVYKQEFDDRTIYRMEADISLVPANLSP